MLRDSFLKLSGSPVSVAKIARRPVSIVCRVQCSRVSLFTSSVEQLMLVSGAGVAYVGKMRLIRCCL